MAEGGFIRLWAALEAAFGRFPSADRGGVQGPIGTWPGAGALFKDDHLAPLGDRPGLQPVQIHTAGHPLASLIAAIPMGGAGTGQVVASLLVAQIDVPDQGSPDIVFTKFSRILWKFSRI